jgi:WD40 repeat protein
LPKASAPGGGFPDLSPDGRALLTDFSWGKQGPFRLWDAATGEPRGGPIEVPQPVYTAAWTADSNRLYLADSGKAIRVVDVATGKMLRTFAVDAEINPLNYSIALSPDERWCALSERVGTITVRDATTGSPFRTMGRLEGMAVNLVFSPDGTRLLGADESGELKIWDVATGREIAATHLAGVLIQVARFSANAKRLAVAGLAGQLLTGEVRILDVETARQIASLKGHSANVKDAVFSPDGERLATASVDKTVRIWELNSGQEILKLTDSVGVYSVRFGSNGRRLIGATRDRRIRVWDATPLP